MKKRTERIRSTHLAIAYSAMLYGYSYDPLSGAAATRLEEGAEDVLIALSIPQPDTSHRTLFVKIPSSAEVEVVSEGTPPKQEEEEVFADV